MFKFIETKNDSQSCVVFLHGFGADMNDLFSMKVLFPDTKVISYQAPIDLSSSGYLGGYAWFSLDFTPYGIEYDIEEAEAVLVDLHLEIDKLRKRFSKLIICGFSQGSILAHALLLRHPGLVDGSICLSGRYSEFVFKGQGFNHLKNLPMFISHGTHDEVIPISSGRQIIDYYQKTEADLTANVYRMGHEISLECQKDLQNWYRSRFLN